MNFNGDSALQQFDSEHQMATALKSLQDALYSTKRSLCNSDFATDAKMIPGFHATPGIDRQTYSLNLNRIDGDGGLSQSDHEKDAGNRQNRRTILRCKSAKEVPGEERHLQKLDAIGPPSPRPKHGEEFLKSSVPQCD
jgi:hypothetical protein